ncbi:MAG: 4Fe-4S dicluster domain-containing protein [Desulfobacterales bacterium]|jgi:Fe-S-cluster-containing hydrogenase component 2
MAKDSSKTGFLSEEELRGGPGIPSEARRQKGAVAVLECLEDIPCNPCESICKFDAITVGEDITTPPLLTEDNCVGCRSCVPICPGQAIFLVDESLPDDKAAIEMPYEYRPLPQKGDIVIALDRAGQQIGDATVTAVKKTEKMDRTATVIIEVPRNWSMRARAIRLKR